jgi:hypothetical protein
MCVCVWVCVWACLCVSCLFLTLPPPPPHRLSHPKPMPLHDPTRTITHIIPYQRESLTAAFAFSIFIREMFYNVFFVLAFPVIYYNEGEIGMYNRALWRRSGPCIVTWIQWCVFVAGNALWITGPIEDITALEYVMFNVLIVASMVIVSLKYSYMSDVQLVKRRTERLDDNALEEASLVGGWLTPSKRMIERELQLAAAKAGIVFDNTVVFTYEGSANLENDSLVEIHLVQQLVDAFTDRTKFTECQLTQKKWNETLATGVISSQLMLTKLLRDAVHVAKFSKEFLYVFVCVAILPAYLGGAVRVAQSNPFFGGTSVSVAFMILSVISNTFNLVLNLLYIGVGIVDYRRRLYVMHRLGLMIGASPFNSDDDFGPAIVQQAAAIRSSHPRRNAVSFIGSTSTTTACSTAIPPIDVTVPRNVYNWLLIRKTLQGFGREYAERIRVFTSVLVLVQLVLTVYVIGKFINSSVDNSMVELLLCVYELIIVSILVLWTARLALRTNSLYTDHAATLVRQHSTLQSRISYMMTLGINDEHDSLTKLGIARDMLKVVEKVVVVGDMMNPIRIFGFDANANFSRGVFTLAVAASGVAIRALLIE